MKIVEKNKSIEKIHEVVVIYKSKKLVDLYKIIQRNKKRENTKKFIHKDL